MEVDGCFTDYVITVKTSNRFGAGTDANAFVQLVGRNGAESEILPLKTSQNVNKFERNQFDQFLFLNRVKLGELKSVRVWHDNSGVGAAWHLEYLQVSDIDGALTYRFPCHRWFSTSEEDGHISREIRCTEITAGPKSIIQTADGVRKADVAVCSSTSLPHPPREPFDLRKYSTPDVAMTIVPKRAVTVFAAPERPIQNQPPVKKTSPTSKSVYGQFSTKGNSARLLPKHGSFYGPYSDR